MYNIGDFCIAKIRMSYDNHLYRDGSFKYRPILIIDRVGKFYKCLSLTSLLHDYGMDRIDVFTNYNMIKHSQIICKDAILVNESSISKCIAKCEPNDFAYILNRYKENKERRK